MVYGCLPHNPNDCDMGVAVNSINRYCMRSGGDCRSSDSGNPGALRLHGRTEAGFTDELSGACL